MKFNKLIKVIGLVSAVGIISLGGLYVTGSKKVDEDIVVPTKRESVSKKSSSKEESKKKSDSKAKVVEKPVSKDKDVETTQEFTEQPTVEVSALDQESNEESTSLYEESVIIEETGHKENVQVSKEQVVKEEPIISTPVIEEPVAAIDFGQAYKLVALHTGLDLDSLSILGSDSGDVFVFEVRQKSPHDEYITNMIGTYKVIKSNGQIIQ